MTLRFIILPGISSCLLIFIFAASWYLGVSDADVVLRGNEYQIPSSYYEKELFQSDDYPLRQLHYYLSKHRRKLHEEEILGKYSPSHGLNESFWSHAIQAALTDPYDWKKLRQALDLIEKGMHGEPKSNRRKNITQEKDLNNKIEKESSLTSRFTYHRVLTPSILNSGRRRMSAITAMSLSNTNLDKNTLLSTEENLLNTKHIDEVEAKAYLHIAPTHPSTSVPVNFWEESVQNKENKHGENPVKNHLQVHFTHNKVSPRIHHHHNHHHQ